MAPRRVLQTVLGIERKGIVNGVWVSGCSSSHLVALVPVITVVSWRRRLPGTAPQQVLVKMRGAARRGSSFRCSGARRPGRSSVAPVGMQVAVAGGLDGRCGAGLQLVLVQEAVGADSGAGGVAAAVNCAATGAAAAYSSSSSSSYADAAADRIAARIIE